MKCEVVKDKVVYLSQSEIGDLAKEIGWGDQRKVAVYISRGKFPPPDVMIGKTKGWSEETVRKWLDSL